MHQPEAYPDRGDAVRGVLYMVLPYGVRPLNLQKGEQSSKAKLSDWDIILIRTLLEEHRDVSIGRIARAFSVSRRQITRIKNYEQWTHI